MVNASVKIFPGLTLPSAVITSFGLESATEEIDRNRKQKRIMLIEDDAFDSMVVKRALTFLNFKGELDWQQESWRAIDKLRNLDQRDYPDVIFLDLKMPRIDGFQFLGELKSDIKLNRIPVIIISTSSDDDDKKKAFTLGAKKYIVKTFDFDEFVDELREIQQSEDL